VKRCGEEEEVWGGGGGVGRSEEVWGGVRRCTWGGGSEGWGKEGWLYAKITLSVSSCDIPTSMQDLLLPWSHRLPHSCRTSEATLL